MSLPFNRFLGRSIAVDRDMEFFTKPVQPLNMIGMLVGQQDTREVFRHPADRSQA